MHIPLGYGDARVSRQLHNCKCISSGLPQPRQERVPKSMQDEFPLEQNPFLAVHHGLTDAMMKMI
jgi:hypothetical protein